MKILWTKTSIQDEVKHQLDGDFQHDFLEVINICPSPVEAFDVENYSLIFTSANAVNIFFDSGFTIKENRVFVVGTRTKEALEKFGYSPFVAKKNAKDLADYLLDFFLEEKFLHFCGNLALNTFEEKFHLTGIEYKKNCLYKTEILFPKVENPFDAVVFFSPSGVRSFMKNNSIEGKKVFAIGQTTEKEIKQYTTQNVFNSPKNTLEDLIKIIKNHP